MLKFSLLVIISFNLSLSVRAQPDSTSTNRFPADCTGIRMLSGRGPGPEADCLNADNSKRVHSIAILSNCMGVNPSEQLECGPGNMDYHHLCPECLIAIDQSVATIRCSCNIDGLRTHIELPLEQCISVDSGGYLRTNGTRSVSTASPGGYRSSCDSGTVGLYGDTGVMRASCDTNGSGSQKHTSLLDLNNCKIGPNAQGNLVNQAGYGNFTKKAGCTGCTLGDPPYYYDGLNCICPTTEGKMIKSAIRLGKTTLHMQSIALYL
ncbi:hypothetical protein C8R43DRAFT_948176 [Mycena crocata]|nr:hypothetical protein C8R43DRAFT_948176 [Mycena crocata]